MPIKSVFFDLDGTLWDYRACSAYVMEVGIMRLNELCGSCELPGDCTGMLNVALLDSVIEGGLRSLSQCSHAHRFDKFLQRCGISDRRLAGELGSHCHAVRRLSARTFLRDDAHETLRRLKNRGVRVGVLTNGTPGVKRNIIELLGLRDVLDYMVLAEAEGYVKPNRRIFSRCIELAGAEPAETLFVGDSFFTDLLGAKRAGAKAMLLCQRKVKIPTRIPPPDFALKNLKDILKIVT